MKKNLFKIAGVLTLFLVVGIFFLGGCTSTPKDGGQTEKKETEITQETKVGNAVVLKTYESQSTLEESYQKDLEQMNQELGTKNEEILLDYVYLPKDGGTTVEAVYRKIDKSLYQIKYYDSLETFQSSMESDLAGLNQKGATYTIDSMKKMPIGESFVAFYKRVTE